MHTASLSAGLVWDSKGRLVLKLQSFHYEGECVRPSVSCFKQPDRVWMFRERSFKMSQYMASAYRVHEHSLVMNWIQARPWCMCLFEILLGRARHCASCKESRHFCPLHRAIREDLHIHSQTISNTAPTYSSSVLLTKFLLRPCAE